MLTTGLVAGGARASRRVRRRIPGLLALATASAVALSTIGVGAGLVLSAQEGAAPADLTARLAELERRMPPLPPDEVLIADEETWAQFTGDFVGARLQLGDLVEPARDLFVTASDSSGDVAAAVADAARHILLLEEAFAELAEWESHDLIFPLGTFDQTGVATGADELRGNAEAGFLMLIDAYERALPAYALLRDTDAADPADRQLFEARYDFLETAHAVTIPQIHRALSLPTRQVLRAVDRFQTTAPGLEARARTVRYVCIDRELYAQHAGSESSVEEFAASLQAAVTGSLVTVDCPALDNGNEIQFVNP